MRAVLAGILHDTADGSVSQNVRQLPQLIVPPESVLILTIQEIQKSIAAIDDQHTHMDSSTQLPQPVRPQQIRSNDMKNNHFNDEEKDKKFARPDLRYDCRASLIRNAVSAPASGVTQTGNLSSGTETAGIAFGCFDSLNDGDPQNRYRIHRNK